MHKNDIISLCSLVVGLASAFTLGTPAATALDTITNGHGSQVLAGLFVLGVLASQVIRVLNAPAQGGKQ